MNKKKIHVYFVPGLAASTAIFEYIKLPEDLFEIHLIPWLIPLSKNESMADYAKRMTTHIGETNFVLVGVSFGGIMVQEMSKYCTPLEIIIISSVKHHKELPLRLKIIKNTKAYKLTPIKALINIESFAKYTYGDFIKKRAKLYEKYLSMRDKNYLPWAIKNVLHWKQDQNLDKLIHIHGDSDKIFPIENIKNAIVIEGGTHIMILYKAKIINKILTDILTKTMSNIPYGN